MGIAVTSLQHCNFANLIERQVEGELPHLLDEALRSVSTFCG
jgi:hypothetical protein